MIEFKITQCPEKQQIGNYQHWFNEISFGSANADMLIDDPDIAEQQLRIYLENGQAYAQNLDENVSIKVNGRPVGDDPTPFKVKELLVFGKTQIIFSRIDENSPEHPEPIEFHNAAARFVQGSKETAILSALNHLAEKD